MGTPIDGGPFKCWRCGKHPFIPTLSRLTGLQEGTVREKLRSYGIGHGKTVKREVKRKIRTKAFKLPSDTGPLKAKHRRYLEDRGFDADHAAKLWQVQGTGPVSTLDKMSFKHRIVYPIVWEGQTVSFQTRDITGRSKFKYITCPKERELIPHKDILYGLQPHWGTTGICCEGVMDVWKLGPQAFATLGSEWTRKQARLMASNFERIVVVFDNEPAAQKSAEELVAYLRFRGRQARTFTVKTDPGDLSVGKAKRLLHHLLHEIW